MDLAGPTSAFRLTVKADQQAVSQDEDAGNRTGQTENLTTAPRPLLLP
jgi:hypothetical protein